MNRLHNSFSLIEFMIYNAVGYLMLVILFAAVWSVHQSLSRQQVYNRAYASLVAGHALMRRELLESPASRDAWLDISPHNIAWIMPNGRAYGYRVKKNILQRIEGKYTIDRHQWHDKTTSIVLRNVADCRFELCVDQGCVHRVLVNLTLNTDNQALKINDSIVLRNRMKG